MTDELLRKRIELIERWEKMRKLAENQPPTEFVRLLKRYEEKFNKIAPTEPSSFSEEEWCEILKECIEDNITVEEMFGMNYDDDVDY